MIKRALKYAWRNFGIRKAVLERRLRASRAAWERQRGQATPGSLENSLLVIPSDPYLLTSSLGDQAMIGSILDYWQDKFPDMQIFFATADAPGDAAAREMSATPIRMMGKALMMDNIAKVMSTHRFRIAVLMGADGMDGSYDPSFSGEQIMALDLAARNGADCYITGFSVSKFFNPTVAEIFSELDVKIRVNIRDPLSLERFEKGSGREAQQVADVAFLLKPATTERMEPLLTRISEAKAKGRAVVAVNFHPLLLELEERDLFPQLIDCFAEILRKVAARSDVLFVLLSHDTRGSSSDRLGLEPLLQRLGDELGDRLLLPAEQFRAPEIKALVNEIDLVLSGRMHLMIASLGAGTPVFGIDYKDKMEGLLLLLGLDTGNLMTAAEILADPAGCADKVTRFLAGLDTERAAIASHINHIRSLALRNFEDGHDA
ncbi:MAG: polysaccharide pyruvyl transferase family protein [Sphingomonadaceae bacterium]